MSGQAEMDFGVYVTAACNHARRSSLPPAPDQDGFFDAAGVVEICGRRQCHAEFSGEFAATVQFKEMRIPLTATAPGRWDPEAILAACTRAHGNQVFEVDCGKVKPVNANGLDELKIARVVGADGLRPYLSRKGKHGLTNLDGGEWVSSPGFGWQIPRAAPGNPTWTFRKVLSVGHIKQALIHQREPAWSADYKTRRALRALEDVGLVRIKLGPRGGMATAKVTWTPLAYLPAPALRPTALEHDDEMALEAMAAGVA